MKSIKTKLNKKIVLLILFLVLGTGIFVVSKTHLFRASPGDVTPGLKDVNLEPSTEEDKEAVEENKNELSKKIANENQSTQTNSSPKTVSVVITDASQYDQQIEIRAYVSGVIENGGICEILIKQGVQEIVKKVSGKSDATTTRCEALTVPRSEFANNGQWQVTVSYTSSSASGKSSVKALEIR